MSKKNLRTSGSRFHNKYIFAGLIVCLLIFGTLMIWNYEYTKSIDSDVNNPNILTISAGTQGRFENLDIGLSSLQSNSAYLYLHQDVTNESTSRKVVAGDEFEILGYKILVKSIKASFNFSTLVGASHGSIKLLVIKQ